MFASIGKTSGQISSHVLTPEGVVGGRVVGALVVDSLVGGSVVLGSSVVDSGVVELTSVVLALVGGTGVVVSTVDPPQ